MRLDLRKQSGDGSDGSPPSEAQLFALAILGKPIPRTISPEAHARTESKRMEELALFSSGHVESHRIQSAAAKDRRERELLQWAAQFSTGVRVSCARY